MTDVVRYEQPMSSLELAPQAWKLAEKIASTDFVPTALRGKPEAVLACMLAGHEAGISPMQALSKIHIIEGRPAMAAELMRALVLRHGHELEYSEVSTTAVTAEGRRRGSERWTKVTWTMDDAKRGNLDGKPNWRRWPRAMLIARATSELCRMIFADVLAGISYTIEELEDSGDTATGLVDFGPAEIVDTTTTEAKPRNTARAAKAITRTAAAAELDEPPAAPSGEIPDLPSSEIIEAEIVDGNIVDTSAAAADPPSAAAAEEPVSSSDDWPSDDWPSGDFPADPAADPGRRYTGPQIIAIKLAKLYGITGNGPEARAERLERISKILDRVVGSSKDLTHDEIQTVIAALDAEDPPAILAEPTPPAPEPPAPPETVEATTAPTRTRSTPTPNPEQWSGDQWRELLTARKVKVTETMREAQRLGGLLEPPRTVATLDDVAESGIAVDLLGWIEDLSLDRKAKS